MVADSAFSDKIDYLGESKSRRAYKSHYWFKSYGDFAELVDFAYWWPIGKGLRLHLRSRLVYIYIYRYIHFFPKKNMSVCFIITK